jgi:hypothetical protein
MVTLLGAYLAMALFAPQMPDEMPVPRLRDRLLFTIRLSIVLFVVLAAALFPTALNIELRRQEGPATHVTDGLIQTEVAIQFLMNGKNPYTENYFGTPLEDWHGEEISWTPTDSTLYHNAYLPFLFIVSIPFYLLSNAVLGWYDQRFLYILMYVGTLLLLPRLVERQRDKLCLLAVVGLNFLFTYFLADGRNDIVILFGLVVVTALIAAGHITASALVLGLTLMIKQTAWFVIPFYFLYLIPREFTFDSIRSALFKTWPLFAVILIILVPFLMWDASSFFDDTVGYLLGTSLDSYPIRGWGFSTLLRAVGVIPTAYSAFPFGILELVFGIPTLILLLVRQRHTNTLQQVWLGFAVLSFVIEYFSRFFHDNYFVIAIQSLMIASFLITRTLASPSRLQKP